MSKSSQQRVFDLQELPVPAAVLGENPLWDPNRGQLYWVDIDQGKVHCWNEREQSHREIYHGEKVGGFTLHEDGRLLLFRVQDIVLLCPDSGEITPLIQLNIQDSGRFNDVIADPQGAVYCGRLTCNNDTGGLYRLHLDGRLELLWTGSGVPNGMAFSEDCQQFYWTCSSTRTIYRYQYDLGSGALSRKEVFRRVEGGEVPDGLTIDRDGVLYSARWDGYGIEILNTDADVLGRIDLPVERVTSMIFGGEDMDVLYITTAKSENGSGGGLYKTKLHTRGRSEWVSRIAVPKI
jgi:sugar lactone lactonase YvrE